MREGARTPVGKPRNGKLRSPPYSGQPENGLELRTSMIC